MSLPPNHYDFVRTKRAFLLENTELDAKDLLSSGRTTPIVDFGTCANRFDKMWNDHVNSMMAGTAKQQRTTIDAVRRVFRSDRAMQDLFQAQEKIFSLEYYALLNFGLFGKKTFFLSDGLVEHLACTEMNVTARFIHLPFPACMFVPTSCEAIDALYRIHYSQAPADRRRIALHYEAPISVYAVLCEPDEANAHRHLEIVIFHAGAEDTYLTVKRALNLPDEWSLDQALRTDWEDLSERELELQHGWNLESGWQDNPINDELFYNDGLLFFRIVLNAILYISCVDAEVENMPSERDGLDERLAKIKSSLERRDVYRLAQRASSLPYISVGARVPHLDAGRDQSEPTLPKRKLSIRFMVRGHWKNQACGPGMQDHVLRFIRPYMKGPEMADLINKPYLVK